jgi:16S rRNA (uracil1498-N3)-methyltransferase
VRRTRVGEPLLLGDGRGGLVEGEVVHAGRDALTVRVRHRRRVPEPKPTVLLAQALAKGDRAELAVELATEAGVDAVLPWRAARCVARWDDGPRGAKALAKWRATARAAAKQSRRAWVPEVREPVGTDELARLARESGGLALVLHEAAGAALAELAGALRAAERVLLVVGPEGGITDAELATLRDGGARPVRLGAEVLRTSTAAAVALGALGVLTARWQPEPAVVAVP